MKHLHILALAAAIAAPAAYAAEATLELGGYSTTSEVLEGSTPERGIPFNYMYTYSGGQIIYPNALVQEIADRNGEITSISFRYRENGSFYDGDIEGTSSLWAAPSDLQAIPVGENKKSAWLPFDDAAKADTSIDYEITYGENDFEVTYTFATPVRLAPGQSLLLTASSEITNGMYANMYDFECFGFRAGTEKYTSFYGSDTASFEHDFQAGNLNSWNSAWAPVAKISYTYTDRLPQADAPVFTPQSGTALGPDDKVTISAADGASILYTLEKDATPDIPYTSPLTLTSDATVTAIAIADGYEPSEPASASYTLKVTPAPVFAIPAGSLLGANEKVTVSAADGATILYTLGNEGEPDTQYPADGISLTADATVTAVATMPGAYPSKAVSASYSVSDLDATVIGGYYDEPGASNTFIGTNWYNAPVIPTYANSASQMLYLPEELDGFNERTRIRALSFRFVNETCFTEYTSTAKLYIQAVDNTEFTYDALNSKYRWFDTQLDTPDATQQLEIDFAELYFDCGELTFTLPDGGVSFPAGKSLLMTIVNEAPAPLDNSEYPQFLKYNTPARRTATFASDRTDYAASIAISDYVSNGEGFYSSMTDYNQPCLKIYTDNLGADGIGRVEGTLSDATTACYNLQGIEVSADNLIPGLYIIRQGNLSRKILVK